MRGEPILIRMRNQVTTGIRFFYPSLGVSLLLAVTVNRLGDNLVRVLIHKINPQPLSVLCLNARSHFGLFVLFQRQVVDLAVRLVLVPVTARFSEGRGWTSQHAEASTEVMTAPRHAVFSLPARFCSWHLLFPRLTATSLIYPLIWTTKQGDNIGRDLSSSFSRDPWSSLTSLLKPKGHKTRTRIL